MQTPEPGPSLEFTGSVPVKLSRAAMGLLPNTQDCGLRMPGTFSPSAEFKGNRELVIPACITAYASRTCRDVCRVCLPTVAGKTFPAFPAHAHRQFDVFGKRPMEATFVLSSNALAFDSMVVSSPPASANTNLPVWSRFIWKMYVCTYVRTNVCMMYWDCLLSSFPEPNHNITDMDHISGPTTQW